MILCCLSPGILFRHRANCFSTPRCRRCCRYCCHPRGYAAFATTSQDRLHLPALSLITSLGTVAVSVAANGNTTAMKPVATGGDSTVLCSVALLAMGHTGLPCSKDFPFPFCHLVIRKPAFSPILFPEVTRGHALSPTIF